jgi:threonine dehydratase
MDGAEALLSIPAGVPLTPLERNASLSRLLGCEVLLKCEHLLPTGSFKYRGAAHKLRALGADAKRGVVAASTGNHGLEVAYVARAAGLPARIFAPDTLAPAKAAVIRAHGAMLELVKGGALDAERLAREQAAACGLAYISPYNDVDLIAGHSAIGHEILHQSPDVDAIFVAVGGGGLLAGVGAAAKALKPSVKMIGCWPANAAALYECLRDGALHPVEERPTISDATAGGVEPGSVTFELCRAIIDETVLVTEGEIGSAMRLIAEHAHWIVEGAAGVAVAGMIQSAPRFTAKTVAVVLCGRNIAWPDFLRAVNGEP